MSQQIVKKEYSEYIKSLHNMKRYTLEEMIKYRIINPYDLFYIHFMYVGYELCFFDHKDFLYIWNEKALYFEKYNLNDKVKNFGYGENIISYRDLTVLNYEECNDFYNFKDFQSKFDKEDSLSNVPWDYNTKHYNINHMNTLYLIVVRELGETLSLHLVIELERYNTSTPVLKNLYKILDTEFIKFKDYFKESDILFIYPLPNIEKEIIRDLIYSSGRKM